MGESNIIVELEESKLKLSSLKNDPGNEVKLQIYAFYKQVNRLKVISQFSL